MKNKKMKPVPIPKSELENIKKLWTDKWSVAIEIWSKFIKLSAPIFCIDEEMEKAEGLTGSFAMIRLNDHAVVISVKQIYEYGLQDYSLEILSHEIGHHVFCPGDLVDMGRLLARVSYALGYSFKYAASTISNLYEDLIINDRLHREYNLKIGDVYIKINEATDDPLWTFYMRIYEILFGLNKGTLAKGTIDAEMEGYAQLGHSIIRNFSKDWLKGAGRFAALCVPFLEKSSSSAYGDHVKVWMDTEAAGKGAPVPDGLIDMDDDEKIGTGHPAMDDINNTLNEDDTKTVKGNSGGQCREPFEYGEILKAMGININESDLVLRYYKERAMPFLVPFPVEYTPSVSEPEMEGLDLWDISSPFDNINWFETLSRSPVPIPGYTIYEQSYTTTVGSVPEYEPIDLDIYIDCSGSMPDPRYSISYLALAGTIIALSALRAGSKVQATLWSGKKDFKTTKGFIDDEKEIMKIITGYIGGATAFPIHLLRDTYSERKQTDRKVHILVVSDDGVTTMFDADERKNSGWNISEMALRNARGGGTFVLNLWDDWRKNNDLYKASKQGWEIFKISAWEELIKFAQDFSRKKYIK